MSTGSNYSVLQRKYKQNQEKQIFKMLTQLINEYFLDSSLISLIVNALERIKITMKKDNITEVKIL
jgi:hypothetical protein